MRFDLVTIFPDMLRGLFDFGVVGRAARSGLIEIAAHDLRQYTRDPHRTTDDRPFGGGEGMVMKIEPIYDCLADLLGQSERTARQASGQQEQVRVILLSAQGHVFNQEMARRFAGLARIVLICGRYEGVDERVAEHLADEELSLGDFVLSGGELAAACVLDAVARLLPGVVGHEQSIVNESFAANAGEAILDCPQYTRPVDFHGWIVPDVLRGGDHAAIAAWRREQALYKTRANRPDLLAESRR